MTHSNSTCPSSPSESDSDRAPNSNGARVFWGNLKTPESKTSFVNPPNTVVKTKGAPQTQSRRQSVEVSMPMQADDPASDLGHVGQAGEDDNDLTFNSTHEDITRETEERQEAEGVEQRQYPVADAIDHLHSDDKSVAPSVPSPQSSCPKRQSLSCGEGSESEVEGDAVLQPSSSIDSLVSPKDDTQLDNLDWANGQLSMHSKSASPERPPLKIISRSQRVSELPDLISFDNAVPSPSSPEATLPGPPSLFSPCVTIDDLLAFSPQCLKSESPLGLYPRDLPQSSKVPPGPVTLDVAAIPSPSSSTPDPPSNEPCPITNQSSSMQQSSLEEQMPNQISTHTTPLPSPDDSYPTHMSPQVEDRMASDLSTLGETHVDQMSRLVEAAVRPRTSGAETRKRSPGKAWKGKEKAADGDGNSGESSSNTSGESNGKSSNGDVPICDKDVKKERRAKAKREAELRRRQLQSLSPTSADLLNLLASPDRGSPSESPPPRASGDGISDFGINVSPPRFKASACTTLHTDPSTPARRVPVSDISLPRLDDLPLHFIRPNPVPLDDPNRTPARRILVAPGSPAQPPNRTPARRVPVLSPPSLAKPSELCDSSATHPRPGQGSHFGSVSSAKSPAKPTPSKQPEQPTKGTMSFSLAPTLTPNRVARPLPFPIARRPGGGGRDLQASNSSRPVAAPSPAKKPWTSSLREPSSTSASKIARVTNKPYSRPGHTMAKLSKLSSSRIPVPGAMNNRSGPSRTNAPCGTVVPTRIPSPIKCHTPSVDLAEPAPALPSSPIVMTTEEKATTTYLRKRRRMMTEDESDEPPAKRAVIMVRPVTKGMYNKAALADLPLTGSSTSQREASPVRATRLAGSIQTRPILQGTLGHSEPTRSSSHDLVTSKEDDIEAGLESHSAASIAAPGPLSTPRGGSPVAETDTASTVTTLSREPTLEDLSESSSAVLTLALTEPGPELRRTTRVRKPCGPDALVVPGASAVATRREPIPITRTATMVQRGAYLPSKAAKSSTRTPKPLGFPMNPRQLQALTDANTARNQAYLTELQRKIIRKQGPRPASPTTKVRTIMEKSREEHSKTREARAERRRRRGEGSGMSASSEGDSMGVPSSPLPNGQDPERDAPPKHIRGPGDEEEYETPVRPPKPSRLDPNKIAKNVKWDRGLAKTISEWAAEQAANQAQEAAAAAAAEAEATKKGCLARDATTLRLDPLGNVPEADVPLDDLGRERVTVTRFIYDDDVEANRATKKRKA